MEQSSWVRGACLVLLLVFVLICGVHLAGIHHDSDSHGLGLVDRLVSLLLVAILGLGLITVARKTLPVVSRTPAARRQFLAAAAVQAPSSRMVVPLLC
jgi:hypothetical protein